MELLFFVVPLVVSAALMAVCGAVVARRGAWRLRTLLAMATLAALVLCWTPFVGGGGHGFGVGVIPAYLVYLASVGAAPGSDSSAPGWLPWIAMASMTLGLLAFAASITAFTSRGPSRRRAWPAWIDALVLVAVWIAPWWLVVARYLPQAPIVVQGTVVDVETGRGVPGAWVVVELRTSVAPHGCGPGSVAMRTDREGRFRYQRGFADAVGRRPWPDVRIKVLALHEDFQAVEAARERSPGNLPGEQRIAVRRRAAGAPQGGRPEDADVAEGCLAASDDASLVELELARYSQSWRAACRSDRPSTERGLSSLGDTAAYRAHRLRAWRGGMGPDGFLLGGDASGADLAALARLRIAAYSPGYRPPDEPLPRDVWRRMCAELAPLGPSGPLALSGHDDLLAAIRRRTEVSSRAE